MPEYTRSGDRDAEPLVQWSRSYWIETCFDRAEKLKPCPSGLTGACCRVCHLGPCRFYQSGEEKIDKGVCGASLSVVVARNILRMTAAGASALSDTGRELAVTLSNAASGKAKDFKVKDIHKLNNVAEALGINYADRTLDEATEDVASGLLNEFSIQSGATAYLKRVPATTLEAWKEADIIPSGIDREIVGAMHSSTIGVDQDPLSLLTGALRVAIAGCWGGAMIAKDVSDLLLGTTGNVTIEAGLGVLRDDTVNIVFLGHDPTLPELIMQEISEPDMVNLAKSKGASGIRLSALSHLRHGPDIAGGFTNQELSLITGLADAFVVGLQNVMPSLVDIANNFHTKVICTSRKGRLPGALHIDYNSLNARESVREIISLAIESYPERTGNGERVYNRHSASSGFSLELSDGAGNGAAGVSKKLLNNALADGRIMGIACLIGSDNPRVQATGIHKYLASELMSDDVMVLTTEGGSASSAVSGLLDPDTVYNAAGQSLKEACLDIGIPPIVHMGGSIDNARILTMLASMVSEDGHYDTIRKVPVVVIAPEWFAEKELTAACCFAASGVPVIMGGPSPVESSEEVTKIMSEIWEERFGGSIHFEPDFAKILELALSAINRRRELLNPGTPGEVSA